MHSWRTPGRVCFDLLQTCTQMTDLSIQQDWYYNKRGDDQSTDDNGQWCGDEISQGTRQHSPKGHEVMGHAIETHDASAHVVWDQHLQGGLDRSGVGDIADANDKHDGQGQFE